MKQTSDGQYALHKHGIEVPFMRGDRVHLYSAVLNDSLVLFDTGPDTALGRSYLAENIDLDNLHYVFITHCHPDHCGLMKFLHEEIGTTIVVSRYDALRYQRLRGRLERLPGILAPLGFPSEQIARLQKHLLQFDQEIPLPENYLLLEESFELLASLGLDYLHCPGHSQSDIIYLFGRYAITGDVILRELFQTPVLDVDYETLDCRYSNYSAYCETIIKLKEIANRTLLSAHRAPLESVATGVTYFVAKLLTRAIDLAVLLSEGKSIYDAVLHLFQGRSPSAVMLYLKASETLFIADFLEKPELLIGALQTVDLYDRLEAQFDFFFRTVKELPDSAAAQYG